MSGLPEEAVRAGVEAFRETSMFGLHDEIVSHVLTAALPAIGEWLAGEVCPPRTEQFWPSDAALEIADMIRRLTGAEADRG